MIEDIRSGRRQGSITPYRQAKYVRRPVIRGHVFAQDVRPMPVQTAKKIVGGATSVKKHSTAVKRVSKRTITKAVPAQRKAQRSQVIMRRLVTSPANIASKKVKRSRRGQSLLLTTMAVVVFVVGIGVSLDGWRTNKKIETQVAHAVASSNESSGDEGAPSTDKPDSGAVAKYAVSPTMPRYFKMPQHGITKARILPMAVDANNVLKSPGNVHDVGWYNASALPGNAGAMLLDAHVSSWTTNGVFYYIKDLNPGDTVSVERGDGVEFTYKVVKSTTYDYKNVDMAAAITPVTAGKPGLNMITCAGKVIPGTNEFDKRIVVFAEQV